MEEMLTFHFANLKLLKFILDIKTMNKHYSIFILTNIINIISSPVFISLKTYKIFANFDLYKKKIAHKLETKDIKFKINTVFKIKYFFIIKYFTRIGQKSYN